jgi:hypothetical protein
MKIPGGRSLKAMIEFLLENPEVLKHPQISNMLQ